MSRLKQKIAFTISVGLALAMLLSLGIPANVQAVSGSQIRITEIMYDPSGNGDREFLEIYNGSDTTANLGGMTLFGVDYTFPSGSVLPAGQYGVIVRNLSVFRANNPSARIFGQYGGKLRGSGELISISKNGVVQTKVSYSYGGPWPSAPKDGGPSLSLIRTSANETQVACWGVSTVNGGTPSAANAVSGGSGSCGTVSYPQTASAPQSTSGSGGSGSGGSGSQARNGQSGQAGSTAESQNADGEDQAETTAEEKLAATESETIDQASQDIAQDTESRNNKTKANSIVALSMIAASAVGASAYSLYHYVSKRRHIAKALGHHTKGHHAKHSS